MSVAQMLVAMVRGVDDLERLEATVVRTGNVPLRDADGIALFDVADREGVVSQTMRLHYRRAPLRITVAFDDAVLARVDVTDQAVARTFRDGRSDTRRHRPAADATSMWHLLRPIELVAGCTVGEPAPDTYEDRRAWRVRLERRPAPLMSPFPATWGADRYELVVDAEYGFALSLESAVGDTVAREALHDVHV